MTKHLSRGSGPTFLAKQELVCYCGISGLLEGHMNVALMRNLIKCFLTHDSWKMRQSVVTAARGSVGIFLASH